MERMRWLALATILLGMTASGCCYWADKWCPQHHTPPPVAYQAAPACAPACAPAPPNCTPCIPVCPPGTTTGYPATTWQKPVPANNCGP